MRLNRYLANSGVTSRRKADFLIQEGLVKVNNKIITDFGYKVLSTDSIKLYGRFLYIEKKVYFLLNKPQGVITTIFDELNRKTILNITNFPYRRLYPIGRLDKQTTGVVLLTNDGYFCHYMAHPSFKVKKIYHVILNRNFKDFKKIIKGIPLIEGIAKINTVCILNKKQNELIIELYIGWNRILRRIFKALDYEIIKLDRIAFAGVSKENLKIGQWRPLTNKEVDYMKNHY